MILVSIFQIQAQDRVFTNTFQSNVLSSGLKDIEYSAKWNSKRSNFFNSFNQRIEFEIGLGKNIQTSLYLNFDSKTFFDETIKIIQHTNSIGFSAELKWKLTDPTVNKIGSALYSEVSSDGEEWEFESKLILDKQIKHHLMAVNIVQETEMEIELEHEKVKYNMEYPVSINLGYMYSLNKKIGIGIEAKNFNDIAPEEGWESSLLFIGPVLNFHSDGWYINISCMPQIRNFKLTPEFSLNMDLTEHERFESRILLSFNL